MAVHKPTLHGISSSGKLRKDLTRTNARKQTIEQTSDSYWPIAIIVSTGLLLLQAEDESNAPLFWPRMSGLHKMVPINEMLDLTISQVCKVGPSPAARPSGAPGLKAFTAFLKSCTVIGGSSIFPAGNVSLADLQTESQTSSGTSAWRFHRGDQS